MSSEAEIKIVKKATLYDLMKILRGQLKQDPGKTYTYEELQNLVDAYLEGTDD